MTTSPFLTADRFGHLELNVHAVAEALAPHLGGTVEAANEAFDRPWWAAIVLPCGVRLTFSRVQGAGKGGHVEVSSGAAGLILPVSEWPRHVKFPSATVNTARPLEALAKDIARRVVEPAQAPAAEIRSKAAAVDDAKAQMRATVAAFTAEHPTVRVRMAADERSADISSTGQGAYFTGRLASDGSIYFERVGSIGGDRLAKVLAALLAA